MSDTPLTHEEQWARYNALYAEYERERERFRRGERPDRPPRPIAPHTPGWYRGDPT